ncbi:MAG: hypothetical protein ACRDK7_16085 [Solirubrobacteraceae bacterium]
MRATSVSTVGVIAALAIGSSAPSSQAATELEPGVHVDPGSPAAKQYALPLEQARQTGSPGKGSSAAAAFGAGIHPPGSGGGSAGRRSASGDSVHTLARVSPGASSSGTSNLPAAVLSSASGKASTGGDGSILALIGGGVAILVLGGFGGIVMRRNQRPTTSA